MFGLRIITLQQFKTIFPHVTAPGVELDAQDTTDDTGNAATHEGADKPLEVGQGHGIDDRLGDAAVSYTHLDVYKRQEMVELAKASTYTRIFDVNDARFSAPQDMSAEKMCIRDSPCRSPVNRPGGASECAISRWRPTPKRSPTVSLRTVWLFHWRT